MTLSRKPPTNDHPVEPEAREIAADAFDRYATLIYRFAYRRLGTREDAQDVVAQVFLKAARGFDPAFGEDARRAWLFRAARTAVADIWRSYGDTPAVPLEWYVEEFHYRNETGSSATARVERLLAQLSAVQRRVLELRFLAGKSIAETAVELGITEGNVKVLQYRALRRAAELETEGAT